MPQFSQAKIPPWWPGAKLQIYLNYASVFTGKDTSLWPEAKLQIYLKVEMKINIISTKGYCNGDNENHDKMTRGMTMTREW